MISHGRVASPHGCFGPQQGTPNTTIVDRTVKGTTSKNMHVAKRCVVALFAIANEKKVAVNITEGTGWTQPYYVSSTATNTKYRCFPVGVNSRGSPTVRISTSRGQPYVARVVFVITATAALTSAVRLAPREEDIDLNEQKIPSGVTRFGRATITYITAGWHNTDQL